MAANKDSSTIGQLVAEILEMAGETARQHPVPSASIQQDFKAIAQRDYERDLSRHFSKHELRAILTAVRVALPSLNRQQFRPNPVQELAGLASRLGADLTARAFTGPEGMALRGFYAKDRKLLRRPLICVNTAHHPVAVATAFWHEVGHHLTARIFDTHEEALNLSYSADYIEHLDDPMEVVADMMVCLAAYPKRVARRLFAAPLQKRLVANTTARSEEVLAQARAHLRMTTGFEFEKSIPAAENLHYLAGMIHFVKLRLALFARYDI